MTSDQIWKFTLWLKRKRPYKENVYWLQRNKRLSPSLAKTVILLSKFVARVLSHLLNHCCSNNFTMWSIVSNLNYLHFRQIVTCWSHTWNCGSMSTLSRSLPRVSLVSMYSALRSPVLAHSKSAPPRALPIIALMFRSSPLPKTYLDKKESEQKIRNNSFPTKIGLTHLPCQWSD